MYRYFILQVIGNRMVQFAELPIHIGGGDASVVSNKTGYIFRRDIIKLGHGNIHICRHLTSFWNNEAAVAVWINLVDIEKTKFVSRSTNIKWD